MFNLRARDFYLILYPLYPLETYARAECSSASEILAASRRAPLNERYEPRLRRISAVILQVFLLTSNRSRLTR